MSSHSVSKAPVVAVLNMKGGVGKTTISGNLFRELYRKLAPPSKTLIIDFDAQFNLTQLVLQEAEYESLRGKFRTIWNVLEPSECAGVFETSDDDLAKVKSPFEYSVILKQTKQHELHLVPGDFRLAGLNLREDARTLVLPRKRFADLVAQARGLFNLVVLDCNPSSSFLTRCAVENATHVLVPVRPDKYSVLGLKMVNDYLALLPGLPRKPEILIIMNGVGIDQSSVESEVRGHADFGPQTLVARIRHTAVLTARPDYTGFGADRGVRNSRTVRASLIGAGTELAAKLGLKL
jgi:chromosome partitioning protein